MSFSAARRPLCPRTRRKGRARCAAQPALPLGTRGCAVRRAALGNASSRGSARCFRKSAGAWLCVMCFPWEREAIGPARAAFGRGRLCTLARSVPPKLSSDQSDAVPNPVFSAVFATEPSTTAASVDVSARMRNLPVSRPWLAMPCIRARGMDRAVVSWSSLEPRRLYHRFGTALKLEKPDYFNLASILCITLKSVCVELHPLLPYPRYGRRGCSSSTRHPPCRVLASRDLCFEGVRLAEPLPRNALI